MESQTFNSSIFIHPSADIGKNVSIGDGTYVWNQAQLREGVSVGEKCIISKDVYLDLDVSIGNYVKIQNGVSVYNGVTIEDEVFLGPHMTFTNDFYSRSHNSNYVIQSTLVKKGASIGANATIVCKTTIGEYAMVAAGSVVTKDVPPHALVVGNPAKVRGFVCKCGPKFDKIEKIDNNVKMTCLKCNYEHQITYNEFNNILPGQL